MMIHEPTWSPETTADEVSRWIFFHGRNAGPDLLARMYVRKQIPAVVLREVLPTVWSAAEFPCREIDRSLWVEMFRSVGFIGPEKPTNRVEVWRAQVGTGPLGLSWSSDRDKATWFHERNKSWWPNEPSVRLLHGFAAPGQILMIEDNANARGESEVVVARFGRAPVQVQP